MDYINKNVIEFDSRALKKGFYLGYIYIVIRLVLVFAMVPLLHLLWNKKSIGHEGMPEESNPLPFGFVGRVLRILRSFDAEHFYYVIKNGYNNEKNAAFFPGYPMNTIFLMFPFTKNYIEAVDFTAKMI